MSDLREATLQAIPPGDSTYHEITDAVLAVVIAHMAVTDEDATTALKDFYGDHYAVASIEFDPFKRRDMKAALKSFVARKLKA